MSIIRAPRPQSNFYLLDKKISEDRRLSWAARGVLIFLLGKPDHWVVSTRHLINEVADTAKPLKRDAVRGLMSELIEAGYLRRVLSRGDGGKLGGYDYEVCEQWEEPATVLPAPAAPATVLPAPANPPLVRTDSKQGLNREQELKRASRKKPASAFCLPDWIDADAWQSYEAMRVRINKPMTDDARGLAVGKLDKLRAQGHAPRDVLEQSVFNSWQGLFAVKQEPQSQQAPRQAGKPVDVEARNAAVKEMLFGRKRDA